MRLIVLLVLSVAGGCAGPSILIAEPQPGTRIGVVSLVNQFPSHFVQYENSATANVRRVASGINFSDRYLNVVMEPLERTGFDVHAVTPAFDLLDRRLRLFDNAVESIETKAELSRLAAENNFEFVFVIHPFANYKRQHSRFRSDRLFLEGYGMYSVCGDFQCRNWAINSVSIQVLDVARGEVLKPRDFDFYFWDYMPEDSLWARRELIQYVSADTIDRAADIALEDFKQLYADLLERGRFIN